MLKRKLSAGKRKGAVLMIMAVAMMFMVLPVIGLAIDGAVVYTIRAKLQSATDAAAVAAARSYSKGLNPSVQQGSATTTAVNYFRANISAAWDPVTAPDPVVTFPLSPQPRTIVVNVASTAVAPTYFMKVLNINSVTISAVSEASRREVKIIMVLDRSGSLETSGSCDDLREAAKGFVDTFVDGRDQIGMITFGTSYRVDYPISTTFKSGSGTNLPATIGNVFCTGATSSATAYWNGYQQLIATPEAGVLNVLLFFTDGQPTAVYMNNLEVKSSSPCSSHADKAGVISAPGGGSGVNGIRKVLETVAPPVSSDINLIASNAGCKFYTSGPQYTYQDIVALTQSGSSNEVDGYGNALYGYKTGILTTGGRIRIDDNLTMINVATNALDSAATRARDDANTRGLDLVTFAIGLGGPGSAEDLLMNRVANTAASNNYQSNRLTGMYIKADNAGQLDEAFAQLASETMRFAK